MFTYQVRKRKFRLYQDNEIIFPAQILLSFILKPLQPFGMEYDGGITAIVDSKFYLQLDANTGHISVVSEEKLIPVDITHKKDIYNFNLTGNIMNVEFISKSLNDLNATIESLYFQIPILLNIEYLDAPYIVRVEGKINNTDFGWEIESREVPLEVTNKTLQEKKAIRTWDKYLFLNNDNKYKRIFAALHYFHVACRLKRAGNSPWEFMSEILLNYCKILEVLFPSDKTIDNTKVEMLKLGFSENDINKYYIPSIALRNNIDVAHVDLSTFESEELQVLHKYSEIAEPKFRELLHTVFWNIQNNTYTIPEYTKTKVKQEKLNIINKIKDSFDIKT